MTAIAEISTHRPTGDFLAAGGGDDEGSSCFFGLLRSPDGGTVDREGGVGVARGWTGLGLAF